MEKSRHVSRHMAMINSLSVFQTLFRCLDCSGGVRLYSTPAVHGSLLHHLQVSAQNMANKTGNCVVKLQSALFGRLHHNLVCLIPYSYFVNSPLSVSHTCAVTKAPFTPLLNCPFGSQTDWIASENIICNQDALMIHLKLIVQTLREVV